MSVYEVVAGCERNSCHISTTEAGYTVFAHRHLAWWTPSFIVVASIGTELVRLGT